MSTRPFNENQINRQAAGSANSTGGQFAPNPHPADDTVVLVTQTDVHTSETSTPDISSNLHNLGWNTPDDMFEAFQASDHVEPDEQYVDPKNGKTYIRALSAPADSHVQYVDSGYYHQANWQAVSNGKTNLEIGENNTRISGNAYQDWIEVPVLDKDGNITEDAVNLGELVQKLEDYPLVDDETYYAAANAREQETFDDTLDGIENKETTLTNFSQLEDNDQFRTEVTQHISEIGQFHDNGTYLEEEKLVEAWNETADEHIRNCEHFDVTAKQRLDAPDLMICDDCGYQWDA